MNGLIRIRRACALKKILFLALVSIALIPSSVLADGGVFLDYYRYAVYLPEQKAAIFWDGTNETLILSTKIRSENLTNMAWVIPIPSKTKPEIEEGDIGIFHQLADIFTEYKGKGGGPSFSPLVMVPFGLCLVGGFTSALIYISRKRTVFLFLFIFIALMSVVSFVLSVMYMGALSFTFMGNGGVEPIEIKKVDIYDVATLKATNATALVGWLNGNGYAVPESAVPVLQDYCDKEDFYFIANKINLEDRYNSTAERDSILSALRQGMATPLRITFQPDEAFYPQRISSINDGRTDITVFVISPSPVEDRSWILRPFNPRGDYVWAKRARGLGEKYRDYYVTYLRYYGDLDGLTADSTFSSN